MAPKPMTTAEQLTADQRLEGVGSLLARPRGRAPLQRLQLRVKALLQELVGEGAWRGGGGGGLML